MTFVRRPWVQFPELRRSLLRLRLAECFRWVRVVTVVNAADRGRDARCYGDKDDPKPVLLKPSCPLIPEHAAVFGGCGMPCFGMQGTGSWEQRLTFADSLSLHGSPVSGTADISPRKLPSVPSDETLSQMTLRQTRNGTAIKPPAMPQSQPQKTTVTKTETVFSSRLRPRTTGVMNCPSTMLRQDKLQARVLRAQDGQS